MLGTAARTVDNTHKRMLETKVKESTKAGERTQAAKVPIRDVTAIRISYFCCSCYRMNVPQKVTQFEKIKFHHAGGSDEKCLSLGALLAVLFGKVMES